jgi:hypothetical protein
MSALIIIVALVLTGTFTGFMLWLAFRNVPPAQREHMPHQTYKDFPTRENNRNRPWH